MQRLIHKGLPHVECDVSRFNAKSTAEPGKRTQAKAGVETGHRVDQNRPLATGRPSAARTDRQDAGTAQGPVQQGYDVGAACFLEGHMLTNSFEAVVDEVAQLKRDGGEWGAIDLAEPSDGRRHIGLLVVVAPWIAD